MPWRLALILTRAPPFIVSTAMFILLVGIALFPDSPLKGAAWLLGVLYFEAVLLWLWAIVVSANAMLETNLSCHEKSEGIFFAATTLTITTFALDFFPTVPDLITNVSLSLVSVLYLICAWKAAVLLRRIGDAGYPSSWFLTFFTFIMLLLFPVGIWFIQEELRKISRSERPE